MSNYDDLAARHGVSLAPFTGGYLDLYGSKGLGVLEGFIRENPEVRVISTIELEKWIGRDRQTTFKR
jgi:hypothetical protein